MSKCGRLDMLALTDKIRSSYLWRIAYASVLYWSSDVCIVKVMKLNPFDNPDTVEY